MCATQPLVCVLGFVTAKGKERGRWKEVWGMDGAGKNYIHKFLRQKKNKSPISDCTVDNFSHGWVFKAGNDVLRWS